MKISSKLAIALAAAAAALPLLAAPEAIPTDDVIRQRFAELDKNADGRITADEWTTMRWISKLDANHDGGVVLDEALAFFARARSLVPQKRADVAKDSPTDSPRQEPRLLSASEHGVGTLVPDLEFSTLDGKKQRLSEVAGRRGLVVALVSPSCPVGKRYLPSLAALSSELASREVTLLLVALSNDSPADLRSAFEKAGLKAPCATAENTALLQRLGALATTEVFLLDAARTLIYRGAIDDQYGLGYSLEEPRHRYLTAAVGAMLAGTVPQIAATEAPGCALEPSKEPQLTSAAPTFHDRISRMLQANCQECHRTGGVAPFALETYEQVSAKAGMIRKMVSRNLMPPWFAAAPQPGQHSPWSNDRSLTERDKADLLAWLDASKPLGDVANAPLPRQWPAEWQIGTPDAIVQIPKPIDVKATGTIPYQNVVVDTGLTEDRWVQALEIRPTAREVVHHVLVFVQRAGQIRHDEGGGFFAAYVPGNSSVIYPDGFAKPLPAGAKLQFQIHYTPNGTATSEQVRLGLVFAKSAPQHIVHTASAGNMRLNIPPNAADHAETGTLPVPAEVKLLALMPHMHLRGKAFRYEVVAPGGESRTLLDVPRYDFNWQLAYRFAEPPSIAAGSRIRVTGWFDNSAGNPANPDPNKTVRWGPQTTDEMLLGYVEYFIPSETPPASKGLAASR